MSLIAGKRRIQEGVDDLKRETGSRDARAHREDVGVVVQPCRLGGKAVAAERRADAAELVGGDGNADARATDQNALFAFAGHDSLRHSLGINGIITARLGIGAEIFYLKAALLQMVNDLRFQGKSAVVASDRNHESVPPCCHLCSMKHLFYFIIIRRNWQV